MSTPLYTPLYSSLVTRIVSRDAQFLTEILTSAGPTKADPATKTVVVTDLASPVMGPTTPTTYRQETYGPLAGGIDLINDYGVLEIAEALKVRLVARRPS